VPEGRAASHKVLILGAGGVGKTTLCRQIADHHDELLDEADGDGGRGDGGSGGGANDAMAPRRASWFFDSNAVAALLRRNLVECVHALLAGADELGMPLSSDDAGRARVEHVRSLPADGWRPGNEDADVIAALWSDPCVQAVYARRGALSLSTSCGYLLDNAQRLASPTFEPTVEDAAHSSRPSTGIVERSFAVGGAGGAAAGSTIRLVDVGGRRNERKKWTHCFEDVGAVLYAASLTDYDQALEEDADVNRLKEDLDLFEEIAGSRWFSDVPVCVVLTKRDLLGDRLRVSPLSPKDGGYKGDSDAVGVPDAVEHFRSMFAERWERARGGRTGAGDHDFESCAIDATRLDDVRSVFEVLRARLGAGSAADGAKSTA